MQGLGLFTLEELHYSPDGVLLTRGPGSYKIPAFGDIPTQLTVSLLRDAPNDKAIFASKVYTNLNITHYISTEKNSWKQCYNSLNTLFPGCGGASSFPGIVCFLCHQGCHQCCPGGVRHQRAVQAGQPRLCREDSQCLHWPVHQNGTKASSNIVKKIVVAEILGETDQAWIGTLKCVNIREILYYFLYILTYLIVSVSCCWTWYLHPLVCTSLGSSTKEKNLPMMITVNL